MAQVPKINKISVFVHHASISIIIYDHPREELILKIFAPINFLADMAQFPIKAGETIFDSFSRTYKTETRTNTSTFDITKVQENVDIGI